MTAVDILAVGAHPDDAEVGCGGSLILASEAGRSVAVVDLTRGEAATRGSPEQRGAEAERASAVLGLVARFNLGLPDAGVGTSLAHRDDLVGLIRECRPRIVLAPYPDDRHPDHAAAGRLSREACFFAHVAKVGEGPPHRVDRFYYYMLHQPFTPSFVVDVSSIWERKLEAVMAFETQFGPTSSGETDISSPGFLDYLEARATFYGAMSGCSRGEPFGALGPISFDALPGLDPTPRGSPRNIYF